MRAILLQGFKGLVTILFILSWPLINIACKGILLVQLWRAISHWGVPTDHSALVFAAYFGVYLVLTYFANGLIPTGTKGK